MKPHLNSAVVSLLLTGFAWVLFANNQRVRETMPRHKGVLASASDGFGGGCCGNDAITWTGSDRMISPVNARIIWAGSDGPVRRTTRR